MDYADSSPRLRGSAKVWSTFTCLHRLLLMKTSPDCDSTVLPIHNCREISCTGNTEASQCAPAPNGVMRVIKPEAGECSESVDLLQEKGCTLLLSHQALRLLGWRKGVFITMKRGVLQSKKCDTDNLFPGFSGTPVSDHRPETSRVGSSGFLLNLSGSGGMKPGSSKRRRQAAVSCREPYR